MFTRKETIFITSTQILDVNSKMQHSKDLDEAELEEFHKHADGDPHVGSVSMKEFDDSFNMIIGSTDTEINLLDNPYINI